MDAHKALITNIFNNSTLVEVPFFQRSYVWREDLWARLLEDMEFVVKTKKTTFFGLYYFKRRSQTKARREFCRLQDHSGRTAAINNFLDFYEGALLKIRTDSTV